LAPVDSEELLALMQVAPGFRTESILTARLSLERFRYQDNRRIAAFEGGTPTSGESAPPTMLPGDLARRRSIYELTLAVGRRREVFAFSLSCFLSA
jgi:hypothetical protein